jgi:quinol monooxygenase YgiN
MIIRIVRMTFKETSIDAFLKIFDASKDKIRNRPGCRHLELLEDHSSENIFSTYSIWESEDDLNDYRNSDLFGAVWPDTKLLFAEKPIAHSYQQKIKLD